MITDCHVHIAPIEMFQPAALELMKSKRPNYDQIVEYCRNPKSFLKYLDACGVDRAVFINYVAPEVIGFTGAVNQWVADYVKENPKRLISCGGLHPAHHAEIFWRMWSRFDTRYSHDQNSSTSPASISKRLSKWGERTGNYLPRGGGQWNPRNVSHWELQFSPMRAIATATPSTLMMWR